MKKTLSLILALAICFCGAVSATAARFDPNGDGKINSLDAATILKYDAGLYAFTDQQLADADANGDGKVNSLDAAFILKIDAALIMLGGSLLGSWSCVEPELGTMIFTFKEGGVGSVAIIYGDGTPDDVFSFTYIVNEDNTVTLYAGENSACYGYYFTAAGLCFTFEGDVVNLTRVSGYYKIVTPTEAEIEQAKEKLFQIVDLILSYDCEVSDAYNLIYQRYNGGGLDYCMCLGYETEVTKYGQIASFRDQQDPLGHWELSSDPNGNGGYWKAPSALIDWLVEGVWNGKLNHGIRYRENKWVEGYYNNGFYYSPMVMGAVGWPIITVSFVSQEALPGGKYCFKFIVDDSQYRSITAALKEDEDGFRFWSVYSVDYEPIA